MSEDALFWWGLVIVIGVIVAVAAALLHILFPAPSNAGLQQVQMRNGGDDE